MADWNVNLPDIASCKLNHQAVSNIYDKVGDKYRLLWPHPGIYISKDVTSKNHCSFIWDTIDIGKSYESVTGIEYLNSSTATLFNSNQVTVTGSSSTYNWYNPSETVILSDNAYSCNVVATCSGTTYETTPISAIPANAFTASDVSIWSDGSNYQTVGIGFNLTYNGPDYETPNIGDIIGISSIPIPVEIVYRDGETVTGSIIFDPYSEGVHKLVSSDSQSTSKLCTGDVIRFWRAGTPTTNIPGMTTGQNRRRTSITVTGDSDAECYLGTAWSSTETATGTMTVTGGEAFDPNKVFTYQLDKSLTNVDALTITLDRTELYIKNDRGKCIYAVRPSTGTLTLNTIADPGYALKVTNESYMLTVSYNGGSSIITTVANSSIIFPAGTAAGATIGRIYTDYTYTPVTFSSIDSTIPEPIVGTTSVNTLVVLTYIDNI